MHGDAQRPGPQFPGLSLIRPATSPWAERPPGSGFGLSGCLGSLQHLHRMPAATLSCAVSSAIATSDAGILATISPLLEYQTGARCIRWGNRAPSADRKASSPTAASTPWHCRVMPWRSARAHGKASLAPPAVWTCQGRACRSQSATSGQAGLGRCSFSAPALLWLGQPARPSPRWLSGVADIVQGQVRPVPCRMPVCYTLPIEH